MVLNTQAPVSRNIQAIITSVQRLKFRYVNSDDVLPNTDGKNNKPTIKLNVAKMANMPDPEINISAIIRRVAAVKNATGAQLIGTVSNPMRANMTNIAPWAPGMRSPGFRISKKIPNIPMPKNI